MSLTYIQVHLYFVIPPILLLSVLYWPLLGRRDLVKIVFLIFMATAWTTPWDNFIIYHGGWTYPTGSILGSIFYVPFEEHLFFILQPVLVILLHCLFQHPDLLPFEIDKSAIQRILSNDKLEQNALDFMIDDNPDGSSTTHPKSRHKESDSFEIEIEPKTTVQTLPRRPITSAFWAILFLIGLSLINEAHCFFPSLRLSIQEQLGLGKRTFYLGWILVWVTPVIGWLTWLGAKSGKSGRRVLMIAGTYLCVVDTIAIRNGAWSISKLTTLRIEIWPGLPFEECLFFILTTHLLILASSLISHLHTLLLLSPTLPPCPPSNILSHVGLLAQVAFNPPQVDILTLNGLLEAEETLSKGSKSFSVAKLAFGREMRLGLVAVYAWCRVTDNLIDDIPPSSDINKLKILESIRRHLHLAFNSDNNRTSQLDSILDEIPHLTPSDRSAFHLFSNLIPRLSPIEPFLELCDGYETDMRFSSTPFTASTNLDDHLPIRTTADLLKYADDVAGSIATAICYLAWSILDSTTIQPVEELNNQNVHIRDGAIPLRPSSNLTHLEKERQNIVIKAREMGRALQLVNIARDIAKDAKIHRLYIPLSFLKSNDLMSILFPSLKPDSTPKYAPYTYGILDLANTLRRNSITSIEKLPPTARGGTRAMVASYFEIGESIVRNNGEIDERGVKVDKWRRLRAAAKAMWFG